MGEMMAAMMQGNGNTNSDSSLTNENTGVLGTDFKFQWCNDARTISASKRIMAAKRLQRCSHHVSSKTTDGGQAMSGLDE